MKKLFFLASIALLQFSCSGSQSFIKNIDNSAPNLRLTAQNTFIITQFSTDKKYGYTKEYPINIFYQNTSTDKNQVRFLNALSGPKGEAITYKKLENTSPFPAQRSDMGAGFLETYELSWEGLSKPIILYLNIYEKGVLMVPVGLGLKK